MEVKTARYGDINVRNRPSFFAPPLAWATAHFTGILIANVGAIRPAQTGLIVVSDECSLGTIREISATAATGKVSPLRFAGASPSIVAGLPAIEHGIRGPTVCLTMPPAHAFKALISLVRFWIQYNNIVSVIVITHFRSPGQDHVLKGLVAHSAGGELKQALLEVIDPSVG